MNVEEALLSAPSALHKSVLIMKPSDRVPAILPLDESEFRPLDISRRDESFLARSDSSAISPSAGPRRSDLLYFK